MVEIPLTGGEWWKFPSQGGGTERTLLTPLDMGKLVLPSQGGEYGVVPLHGGLRGTIHMNGREMNHHGPHLQLGLVAP